MNRFAATFAIAISLMIPAMLNAGEKEADGNIPMVTRIKLKLPGFPKGNVRKPLVIRNAKDLQKVKSEAARKQIADQVDFGKQYVVLFAWSGSGQDRLSLTEKKILKKLQFSYTPGRTRDLRGHVYCFAIRNGVAFTVATGRFGGKFGK